MGINVFRHALRQMGKGPSVGGTLDNSFVLIAVADAARSTHGARTGASIEIPDGFSGLYRGDRVRKASK
ncbi:hypothetical protein NXC24_PC00575 (plasmid) [Rhizobium sp. NXC24]|nr:hypothetical protein NXC24_PC00575 [Rhizobium sp. NXC24]